MMANQFKPIFRQHQSTFAQNGSSWPGLPCLFLFLLIASQSARYETSRHCGRNGQARQNPAIIRRIKLHIVCPTNGLYLI
jgi:hypothetical protein